MPTKTIVARLGEDTVHLGTYVVLCFCILFLSFLIMFLREIAILCSLNRVEKELVHIELGCLLSYQTISPCNLGQGVSW